MPVGEVFVPARITKVETIDPGEIRLVVLTLPEAYGIAGVLHPIRDAMYPGNAFLAKPMGARTEKLRRRMYTRSNSSTDLASYSRNDYQSYTRGQVRYVHLVANG